MGADIVQGRGWRGLIEVEHAKGFAPSKEKPTTFLAADKTIPYGEVVKVIDMLGSLGLHKISLDTKHVAAQ